MGAGWVVGLLPLAAGEDARRTAAGTAALQSRAVTLRSVGSWNVRIGYITFALRKVYPRMLD
jgi:hypothetical protein